MTDEIDVIKIKPLNLLGYYIRGKIHIPKYL